MHPMRQVPLKDRAPIIFALLCVIAAFLNALQLTGRIRLVDILTLFFGGFGAGVGIVKTVMDFRQLRKTKA
jgi:hypothetical protein